MSNMRTLEEIEYDIENKTMGIDRLEDEIFEARNNTYTLEAQKEQMESELSDLEEELEETRKELRLEK